MQCVVEIILVFNPMCVGTNYPCPRVLKKCFQCLARTAASNRGQPSTLLSFGIAY